MKKSRSLLAILCLSFLLTGCLGPNSAMNQFRNWNAGVTDSKWGNAAIGLIGVPFQGITWLADVTVFNTWEFWAGQGLVSDPGSFPRQMEGGQ